MLIKIFSLILASILVVLYIICTKKAKSYEYLIENLDTKEYPLKDLYPLGYVLANNSLFILKGKVKEQLIKNAKLLYKDIYVDYYVQLAWAQFLSFSLFFLCIISIFASFFSGLSAAIFLILGVLCIAAFWNMFISKMKEAVENRSSECIMEFPDMISKLSLLISSGMVLREAWNTVAYGRTGELYNLMQRVCTDMRNGASDIEAIYSFGTLADSGEIKKFTGLIIQEIEKGSGNLGTVLINQSQELWMHKRQLLLQKGEKAAGKLIIPLGITFGGIILIIIVAAMASMSF